MTDDIDLAGTYQWIVPDQARAEQLTHALAEFGFPLVTAAPQSNGEWLVTAFDPGPYINGHDGHAAMDAVCHDADNIAARYDAAARDGARCPSDMLEYLEQDAPLRVENPGARPPRSSDRIPSTPVAVDLPLVPDRVPTTTQDLLEDLSAVEWSQLEHAHGPADDVPVLIRSLARPSADWSANLEELLADDLLHQGTCFSATPVAMPFLARLAARGELQARLRLELYLWLIAAAGEWPTSLVRDGANAVAQGREAKAAPWTEEIHSAVAAQVSLLEEAWAEEPVAVRFAVACLAAVSASATAVSVAEVQAMARQYEGTQPGWCLQLAAAMIAGDDAVMASTAQTVAVWAFGASAGRPESLGVQPRFYAMHILAKAARFAIDDRN